MSSRTLATGADYLTWFAAAATARLPGHIGSLLVLVIGVLTSAATLGEPLGWRQCGALALTLSGVTIAPRQ